MNKESIINRFLAVLIALLVIENIYQSTQLRSELKTQMEVMGEKIYQLQNELETNTLVTKVVKIYRNGEGGPQTLSLTPAGWLDFIRLYPVSGSYIHVLDFENMFTFTEIDFVYPEEVVKFLETEKTSFWLWSGLSAEYDGDIYCKDFILYFREYRDGIKILFRNQYDDLEVSFEFKGAHHPKIIYTGDSEIYRENTNRHTYYLVFEDKDSKTIAITPNMEMYQLGIGTNFCEKNSCFSIEL